MTQTLRGLLSLKARFDGDALAITELFHRPDSFRLSHAALDAGTWFSRREVLVSLDRFGPWDDDGWSVDMTRSEVEAAPEWADAPEQMSALPSIVVGPFGSTFSPLLMDAQMRDMSEQGRMSSDPIAAAETPSPAFTRATLWLGREAFGPSGPLGSVEDVRVSEDREMVSVLTPDGEIPFTRLRRFADQGHAIFE